MLLIVVVVAGLNPLGAGIISNFMTSALTFALLLTFGLTYSGYINARTILTAVALVGALNGLYMIWHVSFGAPPWDQLWIDTKGYAALYLAEDVVRPLGLASSSAESTALASLAALVTLFRFRRTANPLYLAVALLCAYAVLLSGTRTYFILLLVAACVLLSLGRKRPLLVLLVSLAAAIPIVLIISSGFLGGTSEGSGRILTTLSGNEDSETSTLPIHIDLAVDGLVRGITSVIGTGSGQIGILATEQHFSSETDLSNYAIVAGIPGLVVCIWAWWYFFRRLGRTLKSNSDATLPALVLIATFTQWFNPSYYGVTAIVWAMFGAYAAEADRRSNEVDSSGKGRPGDDPRRSQPLRPRVGRRP